MTSGFLKEVFQLLKGLIFKRATFPAYSHMYAPNEKALAGPACHKYIRHCQPPHSTLRLRDSDLISESVSFSSGPPKN